MPRRGLDARHTHRRVAAGWGIVMPDKIPTFRPNRGRVRPRSRDDSARPNANARGYCSKTWKSLRALVLVRDAWQCKQCRAIIASPKHAHVDHIVPRSRNGSDSLDNLQVLCASCHSLKTRQENGRGSSNSMQSKASRSSWCEGIKRVPPPDWTRPPPARISGG